MKPAHTAIVIFAAGVAFFLIPTFFRDLWTPDEPRYALVAQQMMWTGDYLVPRRNVEIYKEKPPLLFWGIAAASEPHGHVTEVTVRIPSVIAGAITLVLAFALARRMYGNAVALLSVLVMATAYRAWWQAQNGQIDMLLCACTTLSFYALYRWNSDRRARWLALLYLGMGFGLLAKGPPALLIPALTAIAFYRRDLRSLAALKPWWGIPAALAVFAAWFIPARIAAAVDSSSPSAGIAAELRRQIFERIAAGGGHVRPPWYYLLNLPVDWLPWTIFAPILVIYAWRNRREESMRFILSWIVPPFVFFSIISTKREVYLVPIYPALAILTASSAQAMLPALRTRWIYAVPAIWTAILVVVGTAPFVLRATPYADLWSPSLLVLTALCLLCAVWTIALARRRGWPRFPYALGTQMALLLVAVSTVLFPTVNPAKSARDFCEPVRTLARAGDVKVFSAAFIREEYVFYSEVLHTPLLVEPGASALEERFGLAEASKLVSQFPGHFGNAVEREIESGSATTETQHAESIRALCARTAVDLGLPQELVPDWESALVRETEAVQQAFEAQIPAVLLVSVDHWPWVHAFLGEIDDLVLLKSERVTSREMMMFVNPAAASVLTRISDVQILETWCDDFSRPVKFANHVSLGTHPGAQQITRSHRSFPCAPRVRYACAHGLSAFARFASCRCHRAHCRRSTRRLRADGQRPLHRAR